MKKPIEFDLAKATRKHTPAKVSSGQRGRPMVEVLSHLETVAPQATAGSRLSSAGMRAGAIVRGMRRSANYSQAQLAQKMGVTQERVSEIERGIGPQGPTFQLLEKIAAACGMVLIPLDRERAVALHLAAEADEAEAGFLNDT